MLIQVQGMVSIISLHWWVNVQQKLLSNGIQLSLSLNGALVLNSYSHGRHFICKIFIHKDQDNKFWLKKQVTGNSAQKLFT